MTADHDRRLRDRIKGDAPQAEGAFRMSGEDDIRSVPDGADVDLVGRIEAVAALCESATETQAVSVGHTGAREHAADLRALLAKVKALEAERDEAREALRPFAAFAQHLHTLSRPNDRHYVAGLDGDYWCLASELRRASELLSARRR